MKQCKLCYEKGNKELWAVVLLFPNAEEKLAFDICLDCLHKIEAFLASLIHVH